MWAFTRPIRLIRYLFAWRVNGSLARIPRCLPVELSLFLGDTIANRLPTRQASPWRKSLSPWDQYGGLSLIGEKIKRVPEASWPVETVIFAYPGKLTYGPGELIFWELKLMGESADHGFFLEVILPAVEEAGRLSDQRWQRLNKLWGQFDVHAVYAARGPHWEPIVSGGRLDLSYRATSTQWAEGLTFGAESRRTFDRLTWVTPFDLSNDTDGKHRRRRKHPRKKDAPNLQEILEALTVRMSQLLPGKHHTPEDVWDALSEEERISLRAAMKQAAHIPAHHASLKPAPKRWPGRWIGTQIFPSIPHPIVPYLELASILHVGRQTHFGCGTFTIS